MPNQVSRKFGYAIYLAQMGTKHNLSKPLKGFKGGGVLEIVQNFDTDTYRAIYVERTCSRIEKNVNNELV